MDFLNWLYTSIFGRTRKDYLVEHTAQILKRSENYSDFLQQKVIFIKNSLITLERLNREYHQNTERLIDSDAMIDTRHSYEQGIYDQAEVIFNLIAEIDPQVKVLIGNQRTILSFLLKLRPVLFS